MFWSLTWWNPFVLNASWHTWIPILQLHGKHLQASRILIFEVCPDRDSFLCCPEYGANNMGFRHCVIVTDLATPTGYCKSWLRSLSLLIIVFYFIILIQLATPNIAFTKLEWIIVINDLFFAFSLYCFVIVYQSHCCLTD